MVVVEVAETLQAPVERVWELVTDLASYPVLMDPVRAIRIEAEGVNEDGTSWAVSEWEVELKGSILKWTEREDKDPVAFRVAYEQLDGDLDRFAGYWQLTPISPTQTRAVLVVEFEIGIPMLRAMLEPVAERAVEENSRRMLKSLERTPAPALD